MARSCLVVIFILLVAAPSWAETGRAALNSSAGWCPYEHQLRLLDFGEAVSACGGQLVEESKRASCCRRIASRVAVAAAQYTNSTGLLPPSLPKQQCLDSILSALDAGGVPPAASRSCGAGISLGGAPRCGSFHAVRAVRELPGFDKLVEACEAPAQCSRCITVAKRFAASLASGRVASSRAPCRDATFLALASVGNASYAMDKATCMFGLEHGQPAGCPLELNPWQIQNVASACLVNASNTCCSLSLLTLRIAAAKVSLTASSGQLFIPARQAVACIDRLADSISGLTAAPRAALAKCGLSAQNIFNDVRRGCNGIATLGELEHALASRGTNWSQVLAACNQLSCAECRRAALDAAYAAAWPYFDPATTHSCTDLVFLMLAAASSTTKATQAAACLYALPVFATGGGDPAFAPAVPPAQWESSTTSAGGSVVTVALVVGGVILGIALVVLLLYLLFRQHRRRHGGSYRPIWSAKRSASLKRDVSPSFRRFEYSEIQQATDNFTSVIREGTVYKACFKDGLVGAVTRRPVFNRRLAQPFVQEAELLGRLHHRHLLTLRGFCISKADEFLVYDYCGIVSSLEEHLHGGAETVLHWRARMDIAVAVASGLEYLHCYCEPPLCHGGIKSSNVLLDENLVARVANFLAESDELGPDDPEKGLVGCCTDKTDILSFGLLLWELVTGKRCSAKSVRVHGHQLETWRLLLMLDPRIDKSTVSAAEVRKVVEVAKLCCQEQAVARPSMKQVLGMLVSARHTSSRRRWAPHHFQADAGDGETDTSSIDVHPLKLAAAAAAHGGGLVFEDSFGLEGSSPTLSLVSLESD